MTNRICLLFVVLMVGLQLIAVPTATAQALVTVKVFPFTGEIRFLNRNVTPAAFVHYSITSTSATLYRDDDRWLSIADTYDVSGNGFIDAVNEWVEFAPNPMNPDGELAEGVSVGTGALPPVSGISLGKVLDPGVTSDDLVVEIKNADQDDVVYDVQNAVDGDYDDDGDVDMQDYGVWSSWFGSPIFNDFADGNLNGELDAGDYTLWRDNLGKNVHVSFPGAGEAAGGLVGLQTAGVPEPASLLLAMSIGGSLCLWRMRRQRAPRAS